MTPLVEKGLNAITIGINLSTGLSYPSDMNRAKEMFHRLHKAGEKLLAEEICAWAKMNGWRTKDADELGSLGEQIGKGEKMKIPDGPWWNDNILELLMQNIIIPKKNRIAEDLSSCDKA
jgi:hypothetical protein